MLYEVITQLGEVEEKEGGVGRRATRFQDRLPEGVVPGDPATDLLEERQRPGPVDDAKLREQLQLGLQGGDAAHREIFRMAPANGGIRTPFSVTMADRYFAGVTSKEVV